jgi:hypothetical protein
MLRPRFAIFAALGLFALYVLSSVLGSLAPPQSSRTAADSYGTGRLGFRGLYEVLERAGLTVQRETEPPQADIDDDITYVLLDPDPLLLRTNSAHLQDLADSVRRGGRLIVSPAFPTAVQQAEIEEYSKELKHFDRDLLEILGLADVRVELILSSAVPERTHPDDEELVISTVAGSSTGDVNAGVRELVTLGAALPQITQPEDREFVWQTRTLDANGAEIVLAAALKLGAGEVVVVADSTLLCNAALARGDNAPWAAALFADGGRGRLIFGEFYHGHSVRGNAWWLLTIPQFAIIALCGLILLGLWTWRNGVLLGPPLAANVESRRGIGEYLDAMSRFLTRSRESPAFLLEQVRQGVWRRLCQRYNLPPAGNDVGRLLAAMERRDPAAAEGARSAFREANRLRRSGRHATAADCLKCMQDLTRLAQSPTPQAAATESRGHTFRKRRNVRANAVETAADR